MVLALVVIGKYLDDAAGLYASVAAPLDHPTQFCLQRSQACNLASEFGEARFGDCIRVGAGLVGPILKASKIWI